jgi:hypothetical protein
MAGPPKAVNPKRKKVRKSLADGTGEAGCIVNPFDE